MQLSLIIPSPADTKSYEEDLCLELDRCCIGHQDPVIMYTVTIDEVADTDDEEVQTIVMPPLMETRFMFQQFMEHQQGRWRRQWHLSNTLLPSLEHIHINPELTQEQNEERWQHHHWGQVRQAMRTYFLGIPDTLIDGVLHNQYSNYHQNRHTSI